MIKAQDCESGRLGSFYGYITGILHFPGKLSSMSLLLQHRVFIQRLMKCFFPTGMFNLAML